MVKSRESKLTSSADARLAATVSTLHPADFPIGSAESRAAARAMLRPGQLRAGDKGVTEEGEPYLVVKKKPDDPRDPRLLIIVLPRNLRDLMPPPRSAEAPR